LYWSETLGLPCPIAALGPLDWKFEELPRPSAWDNHNSAMEHVELLEEELDRAERLGLIEYPAPGQGVHDFVTCINPFGVRLKPNGKPRILVDPTITGVNQCMSFLPVSLMTPEQFFAGVAPSDVLGKRDLSNGFFHCVLSLEARKYMGFKHPRTGKVGRWVALPQGTAQSPHFFCELTEFSKKVFNHLFAAAKVEAYTDVYVDDYPMRAKNHEHMRSAFEIMDEEADLLGLEFNPNKDEGYEKPCTALDILGLIMNAKEQVMMLSETKRELYAKELTEFLKQHEQSESCDRKALERLAGKFVWAAKCCRWGMLFVQHILDALYPTVVSLEPNPQRPKKVPLTEGARSDLCFWTEALKGGWSQWLGLKHSLLQTRQVALQHERFQINIFSDASKKFGIGGVKGHAVFSRQWAKSRQEEHIGVLELEAFVENVEHWAHDLEGKLVLGRLDNIQAVVAINKGASRLPEIRSLLLRLALLGMRVGFEVKALHIPGTLNPADAPSRGKMNSTEHDWMFTEFSRWNKPVPATIDCCSAEDGHNVQRGCTKWFSSVRPVEENVASLSGHVSWACIPFKQIHTILSALVQAWKADPLNTVITAVVPKWETTGWYRKYIRCKKPVARVLMEYPAGSRLFTSAKSTRSAGPCPYTMLVIRIGQGRGPR
jgi:hypothetical protein